MTAAISVILPTADDFGTIRNTVRALRNQTARGKIELVIVAPVDDPGLIQSEVDGFAGVVVVNGGPLRTSNLFRVTGIRRASAPVVVLAEDHSFPEPEWAQALIDAHASGDFAVAGPVFRNANPSSMLSWANLLLEYAPWFEGAERGERDELPGHNSAYKRDHLLTFRDRLEQVFEVESVVQRELRERGGKLLLEPAAITSHLNFSRLRPVLYLRLNAGRSFAGHRTIGWSVSKRIAYAIASPLIPLVRFVRITRHLASSARYSFLLPGILPALITCLAADGFGELVGYVSGPGSSPENLGAIEFNRRRFMNSRDVAELVGRAASVPPVETMEPAAVSM
jgi:hypothetical protein